MFPDIVVRQIVVAALLLLFAAVPGSAAQKSGKLIWGKVLAVDDGDTIRITDDQGQAVRVQLAYIDAPDLHARTREEQPFYRQSRSFLKKLLAKKEIIVESFGKDKFGKEEGMVFLDRLNINREMVRKGFAEIYQPMRARPDKYNRFYLDQLFAAEKLAKEEKTGVWSDPNYVSPYQFRRSKR